MNFTLLQLLTTSAVTIIGWYIAHRIAVKRDQAIKKRDLQIQYLIDAYRKLESITGRKVLTDDDRKIIIKNLESAIADILLFGSSTQIKYAYEFTQELKTNMEPSLTPLLTALRNDLRLELNLPKSEIEIRHLRIPLNPPAGKADK
jgi:hypothetical protein